MDGLKNTLKEINRISKLLGEATINNDVEKAQTLRQTLSWLNKQLKKEYNEILVNDYTPHSLPGGYARRELLEKFSYKLVTFVDKDADKIPLDFRYFNYITSINKFPMLKNRRKWDPILNQFMVSKDVDLPTTYGLPKPNLAASYLSLNKYGKSSAVFDDKAIIFAYRCLEAHFGGYMSESDILPYDVAVSNMDRTTSCGFPWNQDYADKNDMLDKIPEVFEDYCNKCWNYLVDPDYWFIFTNSLKEEIRPLEKIKLNKIRTFTASPVEAVVNGYRLFGDMNQKFYDSYLKTASVVGLCPFYGGWDELYRKLKNHPRTSDPIAYELDESEYDSSLSSRLFDLVLNFRWNCLKSELKTEDNWHRMGNYYKNLVNSVIITADGHIVQKKTGNPSGSVNTIVDNTLILYILLTYAWYLLAPEERRTYSEFSISVVLALQGDDNTWTVDPETDVFYNARSVSNIFKSVGITTTSPSYNARKLEEVEFLSSSFSNFIGGKCVYNLDPEKLIESLKWTSHPGDPVMTLTRVAAMLRVCWPDREMRSLCREIAQYIMNYYDNVMGNDIAWIQTKAQILSDMEYSFFYLGYGGPVKFSHIKREIKIMDNKQDIFEITETTYEPHARKKRGKGKKVRKERPAKKRMPRRGNKPKRQRRKKGMMNVSAQNGIVPVGIASSGITGPRFRIKSSKRALDAIFVEGHERVASINVPAGGVTEGAVLLSQLISPELIGARLPQYANLYDRYCFTKMTFKYVPLISAANAAANGGVILAIEYDPNDPTPAASTPGMNAAFSWEFSEMNAVFSMGGLNAKNITPKNDYYIDTNAPSDQRFSKQARFYVFANGALAEGSYGYIIFEYAVHLYVPQVNQTISIVGGAVTGVTGAAATNVLGTDASLDAQGRGVSVNAAGEITFRDPGSYLMSMNVVGTGLQLLDIPTGVNTIGRVVNAAGNQSVAGFRFQTSLAGQTIGPFTMASITTITQAILSVGLAPNDSLSLAPSKQIKTLVDIEDLCEQVYKKLSTRRGSEGFVKLPRLKSKKAVEENSEEE